MRIRYINATFVIIGLVVGIIISFQIRVRPVSIGSFPLDQYEAQKSVLAAFSTEQDSLKKSLSNIEAKLNEQKQIIEKNSSRGTQDALARLKLKSGFDKVSGEGISITLSDNPSVFRTDFSSINEGFVQATDLRDLVNGLFLQDARAIAINGVRVLPLTPIQPVFDSILVGNLQVGSPFIVTAIGNTVSLEEAVKHIEQRKIQIYIESPASLEILPAESSREFKYLSNSISNSK